MLTIRDVAGRLNCSPAIVYALCAGGRLPHVRIGLGRGTIRIAEADLDAYLTERRAEADQATRPAPLKLKHLSL